MVSVFALLPEELTEHILSMCVTAPLEPPAPRPIWLAHATSVYLKKRDPSTTRSRLAPLLVSKDFHRIALSHFYDTVHIGSPNQAAAFLVALRTQGNIASFVRRIVCSGIFPSLGAILQCCKNISDIDFCLDASATPSNGVRYDLQEFCDALDGLEMIRRLTLRKAHNAYLTLPRTRYVLTRLAATVQSWSKLESANVAFRMSDDNPQALLALAYPSVSQSLPPLSPSASTPPSPVFTPFLTASPPASPTADGSSFPTHVSPISLLTKALARSPSLHTFSTHVPSVWNETILCVSKNPSLQKIVLGDPKTGVLITGLFMDQAKKHPRLVELIKAGTPLVRTRAHTMDNPGNGVFFNNSFGLVIGPSTVQSTSDLHFSQRVGCPNEWSMTVY
ncbi:hypothetical protein FB446DRAFT_718627 [Lentinula raphanica]|nr:hypothetical protein FB446DRAFT_718627 [Lentinula raphanica]